MGSKMYSTNLTSFKEIIKNDFTIDHILTHRNYLKNAVTDGYESGQEWVDSDIELMTELMVYGGEIFHNIVNSTSVPASHTVDKTQLSLFRLKKDTIIAFNNSGTREIYWLRDVVDNATFAVVANGGYAASGNASHSRGIRPAFLIY